MMPKELAGSFSKKVYLPAFGCGQGPKAGQITQRALNAILQK